MNYSTDIIPHHDNYLVIVQAPKADKLRMSLNETRVMVAILTLVISTL